MGTITGTATLEGSSDNSGILINVLGTGCVGSTNVNGAFTVTDVPTGARYLIFTKEGWQNHTMSVIVQANTSIGTIELSLERGSLEGMARFVGKNYHQGILVEVGGMGGYADVTSPNGVYQINNVPEGQYTVKATYPNYSQETATDLKVESGQTTPVPQLQLKPTLGTITGTATLEGAIERAGIILGVGGTGCLGVTDDNGAFTIKDVPLGTKSLIASRSGWENHKSTITITPGETENVGTIQLSRKRASLEGVVTLAGKQYHQGILVELEGAAGYTDITSSSGAYQINNVPEGQYTVKASYPKYESASATDQTVKAGMTTAVPRLELQPSLGTITGTVKLEGQKSHLGILVSVVGTGCLDVTDVNGAFIIKDVPVGTRTVIAIMAGWERKALSCTVQPGQSVATRGLLLKPLSSTGPGR